MNSGHMIVNSPNFGINLSPSAVRGALLLILGFYYYSSRELGGWRRWVALVALALGADQFFFNGEWIWANRVAILHGTGDFVNGIIEALITCLKGIEMVIGH